MSKYVSWEKRCMEAEARTAAIRQAWRDDRDRLIEENERLSIQNLELQRMKGIAISAATKDLLDKYGRAQLGVDGNCGFALLGDDLQEGESEFVEVGGLLDDRDCVEDRQSVAARRAFNNLKKRLGLPDLSYYLGKSHPMFLG